ncbi:pentapeptide repeat-containing protein [Salmonella enterica]|nr:pentapeptide repeat-containing protein [Salmonella enterica]
MNAAELSKILEEHKLWITSLGQEGASADLRDANLCNADLYNADLRNANLCNANLCNADLYNADLPDLTFVIMGEEYPITITNGEYVRAGCQHHTVEEWRNFSKQEIAEMDGRDALKFYPRLLDIIDFYLGKGSRPDWLTSKEYTEDIQ